MFLGVCVLVYLVLVYFLFFFLQMSSTFAGRINLPQPAALLWKLLSITVLQRVEGV